MIHRHPRTVVLPAAGLLALVAAASLHAQQPRPPTVYNLVLSEQRGIAPGLLGSIRKSTDPNSDGDRIVVENLTIVRPASVAIVSGDSARPLEISLVKGNWDEPLRRATTERDGMARLDFRTEGNLGIRVRAIESEPAPYSLIVWTGDERPRRPAPVFSRASAGRSGGGAEGGGQGPAGSTSTAVGLGMAAVAIAIAATWFVARRKRRGEEERHG